jgi:hypothetical protein
MKVPAIPYIAFFLRAIEIARKKSHIRNCCENTEGGYIFLQLDASFKLASSLLLKCSVSKTTYYEI